MKNRQPRIATLIAARLNSDDGWSDVVIRNISAHGAMLQLAAPPRRGTYVELRRGTSVIVGRTIWNDGQHCGIQTQDRVPLESWLSATPAAAIDAIPNGERRHIQRAGPSGLRIEARSFGLLLQSFLITVVTASFAIIAVSELYERVAPIITTIRDRL